MFGLVLSLCALLCSALSLAHSGHSVLVRKEEGSCLVSVESLGPCGRQQTPGPVLFFRPAPGQLTSWPCASVLHLPIGKSVHLRRPLHGSPLASARFRKRSSLAVPRPLDLPSSAPRRGRRGAPGARLEAASEAPGGWSPPVLQNEEGGPGGALRGRSLHPVVGPFLPAPRPPRGAPALNQFGRAGRVWRWAGSPEPPRLPGRLLPPPAARPAPAGHPGLAGRSRPGSRRPRG